MVGCEAAAKLNKTEQAQAQDPCVRPGLGDLRIVLLEIGERHRTARAGAALQEYIFADLYAAQRLEKSAIALRMFGGALAEMV